MTFGSGESKALSLEDLLRQGIEAAKMGNKDSARLILRRVLDQDKRNERAWLWLASVEDDPIERRRVLQTVLDINPANANAQKLLKAMDTAVARSEQASMRFGISVVLFIIVLLAIVGVIVVVVIP
ncbi:MAG: hypothetical protein IAE83_20045 [Anaerolinea sp.]|nr:hypothetical protein [Anaerolinea sp.]MCC6975845.1 hypothetical protein [Anaerolineae bacterium]CAG1000973.1 hypothetical protein ANRL4_03138 [Anaerolineae bacterium]